MQYEVYTPRLPLAHFVEHLWALRDQPAHTTERIVPTGTLELVINLSDDRIRVYGRDSLSGAVVSGAYRRYFAIDTQAHASIIGVHFRPGAAGALFGLPAGELADSHVVYRRRRHHTEAVQPHRALPARVGARPWRTRLEHGCDRMWLLRSGSPHP
jgi:hypothetical protein